MEQLHRKVAVVTGAASGIGKAKVAEQVVAAIKANQFWLFTDELADDMIRERHADIERKATPTKRSHLVELMMLGGSS